MKSAAFALSNNIYIYITAKTRFMSKRFGYVSK